jgi:hypothetical protein
MRNATTRMSMTLAGVRVGSGRRAALFTSAALLQ